jgi:hypothetical protein
MIVAYNSKPVIMGAFFDTIIKRNMAAVKSSIESVKKTVDKARTQATIKQEQQKTAKRNLMIAGAGIVGFVVLRKLFQGNKRK